MSTNIEVQNFAAQNQQEVIPTQEQLGRIRKIVGRIVLSVGLLSGSVIADSAINVESAHAVTDNYPDKDTADCSGIYGRFS